jgi:hypothetical protein
MNFESVRAKRADLESARRKSRCGRPVPRGCFHSRMGGCFHGRATPRFPCTFRARGAYNKVTPRQRGRGLPEVASLRDRSALSPICALRGISIGRLLRHSCPLASSRSQSRRSRNPVASSIQVLSPLSLDGRGVGGEGDFWASEDVRPPIPNPSPARGEGRNVSLFSASSRSV